MAEELVCTSSTVINCNNRQLHDVSCLEKDEKSCDCILELHLCFNYITGVPAETLAVYSRLTHLSLACNNLTSLPPSLQMCCPQLRRLSVANNRVSVIENVEGLLHLECLDLRCNRIRCVDNIMNLSNLKELSLSGNQIASVCWSHFPSLPALYFLGLYNNELTDFELIVQQLSQKASNLRWLNIGCNPFSDDRQLSLHAALLAMNHVDSGRAQDLLVGLEQVFVLFSGSSRSGEDELKSAVESVCKAYAEGRDCKRLLTVATILMKLKLYFPRLEKIDENTSFSRI